VVESDVSKDAATAIFMTRKWLTKIFLSCHAKDVPSIESMNLAFPCVIRVLRAIRGSKKCASNDFYRESAKKRNRELLYAALWGKSANWLRFRVFALSRSSLLSGLLRDLAIRPGAIKKAREGLAGYPLF
jgi:hypothetical protein